MRPKDAPYVELMERVAAAGQSERQMTAAVTGAKHVACDMCHNNGL